MQNLCFVVCHVNFKEFFIREGKLLPDLLVIADSDKVLKADMDAGRVCVVEQSGLRIPRNPELPREGCGTLSIITTICPSRLNAYHHVVPAFPDYSITVDEANLPDGPSITPLAQPAMEAGDVAVFT